MHLCFVVRPAGLDPDDAGWREQIMALEASTTTWTGNDARALEYGEEDLTELRETEPVLASAATEGVELFGSLRELERGRRRGRG